MRRRGNADAGRQTRENMLLRAYQSQDEAEVVALWERCGLTRPWNDPRKDIARKLTVQPELFVVLVVEGAIAGTVMAGYDGHRGWMNYLAVAPERQHRGYGRALVEHAERALRELGCPKLNLQVRSSNASVLEFYRRLGYLQDDVVSLGKRFEQDESG
jgi:ribosomal protein S18 acetylase RimI-like enzyme